MMTNTPENEPWNASNAAARWPGAAGEHAPTGPHARPGSPTGPGTPVPVATAPPGPGLSWPLVLGLGAVALVWPLVNLTGIADAFGRPAITPLVALTVALIWVGVVGLGGAPRPVLTLTLAGVAYEVYLLVLGIVLGPALGEGGIPLFAVPWAVVPVVALGAFYGFLAGLVALLVQNVRGGRS